MLKVGLVGIGGMGSVHYDAYLKTDKCKLVAVADVRSEMAREKVKDTGINIYSGIDELIENEELDILDICTPSYLHADMSIKALEKGINVLCEKPMTLSTEEAERVIKTVKKTGKKFMVAHVVRFMSAYTYLAEALKSDRNGKLLSLDMKRLSTIPTWTWEDWMRNIEKSGGAPIDLSIHDIDLVQSVLGMPDEVSGTYHKLRNNSDYITSILRYGEAVVTIEGAWYNCELPFHTSYRAVFENGYIEFKGGKVIENGEEIELKKGEISSDTGINISGVDGYAGEIYYFLDCVNSDKYPDFVTPESSMASISLVENIIKNSVMV